MTDKTNLELADRLDRNRAGLPTHDQWYELLYDASQAIRDLEAKIAAYEPVMQHLQDHFDGTCVICSGTASNPGEDCPVPAALAAMEGE